MKRHWSFALVMIAISFGFLAMQYCVLSSILVDAFHPTCSAHTDCREGTYCGSYSFPMLPHNSNRPRCFDCEFTKEKHIGNLNCSAFIDNLEEWQYESIDHSIFRYNRNVDIFSNESLCLSQLHCNATDLLEGDCDDYWFNKWRLGFGYIVSFVFLSVAGLAPYIATDIEEAVVEETILDCILHPESPPLKSTIWFGVQVMYFLTRGRQFVLPFVTAQATASVFLSDTFSIINMILNILSITFLLEIDDIFVEFIMTKNQIEEMTVFFREMLTERNKGRVSIVTFIGPRFISIAAITIMIFVTININGVLNIIMTRSSSIDLSCSNFTIVLAQVFPIGIILFMALHSLKVNFSSLIQTLSVYS